MTTVGKLLTAEQLCERLDREIASELTALAAQFELESTRRREIDPALHEAYAVRCFGVRARVWSVVARSPGSVDLQPEYAQVLEKAKELTLAWISRFTGSAPDLHTRIAKRLDIERRAWLAAAQRAILHMDEGPFMISAEFAGHEPQAGDNPVSSGIAEADIRIEPAPSAEDAPPAKEQLERLIGVDAKPMPGLTWPEIEICFTSDHRVQIRARDEDETRNYTEMGFEDRRSHKPNRAWHTLRLLAESNGVFPIDATDGPAQKRRKVRGQVPDREENIEIGRKKGREWAAIEKRIEEIRRTLRELFRAIPGDPIPWVKGTGYQAQVKLRCAPSYNA